VRYNDAMTIQSMPLKQLEDRPVRLALRELKVGLLGLYGSYPPRLVAYGSYARDEATEDSDLDLLLLYSRPVNPSHEIARIVPLLAALHLQYGLLISVLPVSERDYRESEGPFWRNVRQEGVAIHAG
jgi:uncharacterized protein